MNEAEKFARTKRVHKPVQYSTSKIWSGRDLNIPVDILEVSDPSEPETSDDEGSGDETSNDDNETDDDNETAQNNHVSTQYNPFVTFSVRL